MTTTEFIQKLKKIRACKDARDWVATQPDAQTAWDSCTDFGWMEWYFEKTATLKMWEEYYKVKQAALKEYQKVTQPALKEYQKVTQPALKEYQKVQRPALEEYNKVTQPAWEEYKKVCIAIIRKLMPSP